ncbi:hypothetical protein [Flavobacterium reichenbachii]|uniref:Uncharacterized protein n=1 Tax=Flavobacterium reichenbachii TaxID=362418 RepID=A0A085ZGC0_9FLAO|nr:hypothetical protein [Flavobacterium reichenbachii]KFF03484.1 hypothetical protein IW19_21630 [Flavobacterium reichenbachii]OXB15693.1 hypothetical protein B0A68_09900 [Flavobacterium reichenbachii]
MSKQTYVGGTSRITSNGEIVFNAYDGDANFTTNGINKWTAKDGHFVGDYKEIELPEKPVDETRNFPSGWWSKDPEGKIRVDYLDSETKKGFRAELEDVVYFQLRVNKKVPLGTKIKFKLWDHDWSVFMDFFLQGVNLDDDDFGVDGKELFKTGTVKDTGEEYNRITLKLPLTPEWKEQLENETGPFELDKYLDFFWIWTYDDTEWNSKQIILNVYYTRNLYIKEANPGRYRFPEVIDSQTGDFIVFLKNEAGDIVGSIDSNVAEFYAVRTTVTAQYNFGGKTNVVIKKLYEEKINLHTGKATTNTISEVKEFVAFKAKKTAAITKLEDTSVTQVSKKFSDYYNVYDIGSYGIKVLQEAMNILGYIDLYNDVSDAVAGKSLSMYDTSGVMTATADVATKAAMAQETKLGLMTAEEIALMSLPEWVSPVTFGLAVFEETITKPFVAQVMQDIAETMFWKMEYAKRGGLKAVDSLISLDKNVAQYYELIYNIPQQKHNGIFAGKIKTYSDLNKDNTIYHSENQQAKTYTYLLALMEIEPNVYDYNIDTIFI